MTTQTAPPQVDSPHTWTIAETKARLSEILRLADEEGPQRIGVQRAFIVVPERLWEERARPRKPLGQWLVENFPAASTWNFRPGGPRGRFPSLTK